MLLENYKTSQMQEICTQPPTFGVESYRSRGNFFALAFLGLFEHGAQKFQGRPRQKICLDWALKKPIKLQEKKTMKKLKAKKDKNKFEREWTHKHEIGKLGNVPQIVVLFVCPPPPTRIITQWIYLWESQAKK
jgi:hypothetical protein